MYGILFREISLFPRDCCKRLMIDNKWQVTAAHCTSSANSRYFVTIASALLSTAMWNRFTNIGSLLEKIGSLAEVRIRNMDFEKKRCKRSEAQQMRFLRLFAGLSLEDHVRKEVIREVRSCQRSRRHQETQVTMDSACRTNGCRKVSKKYQRKERCQKYERR
jgi:hypothetical protein